ncbi:MAG: FAD-dependent oxidoreductase, partial [Cyanobacteriota bacterium]|nr:FAD-dependent oxidoreductase [Cyanobacteriota bacterium]
MLNFKRFVSCLISSFLSVSSIALTATSTSPPKPDQEVACDVLVIGGGLAGSATAYEALLLGRTVCMTEITDWVGGQISSQGTSALDERATQRSLLYFPIGYLELRNRIEEKYGRLNPGACWVSASCFMPYDGHKILFEMLEDAAKKGRGTLKWFPSTVVKDLDISNRQITSVTAIQHQPASGTPPLNTEPLSQIIEDAYQYEDSNRLTKTIIRFVPPSANSLESNLSSLPNSAPPSAPQFCAPLCPPNPGGKFELKTLPFLKAPNFGGLGAGDFGGNNQLNTDVYTVASETEVKWYVIEATETGEILGLTDVPYRLGVDPRTPFDPTSSSVPGAPYCTQGFTYTFAMEATAEPQTH